MHHPNECVSLLWRTRRAVQVTLYLVVTKLITCNNTNTFYLSSICFFNLPNPRSSKTAWRPPAVGSTSPEDFVALITLPFLDREMGRPKGSFSVQGAQKKKGRTAVPDSPPNSPGIPQLRTTVGRLKDTRRESNHHW